MSFFSIILGLSERYYKHTNFNEATLSHLYLFTGGKKTNSIDEFFHVGYTWDRHAEFVNRPLIVTALELCTPEVVDFLIRFGSNLSKQHEGKTKFIILV